MAILLLRHATAGRRRPGDDADHLRPLDERGRRQADLLPGLYAGYDVERLLTSPYVRCRQSVEPLAAALGLPVEERSELAEGASESELRAVLRELEDATSVLSTHGDVIAALLGEELEKGATQVLALGPGDAVERRELLPPPV
jgi:8-oxo-dGTP diphosphatase